MEKGICLIERLYVPYGQTVRFETLRVDKLIVDGNLIVEGKISAVICRGKGSVQVGDMEVPKMALSICGTRNGKRTSLPSKPTEPLAWIHYTARLICAIFSMHKSYWLCKLPPYIIWHSICGWQGKQESTLSLEISRLGSR